MKKIKTAFIYKPSNPYMSKTAWATTYYHFFMNALNRHPELEMNYFPAEKKFDTFSSLAEQIQKDIQLVKAYHSKQ